MEAVRACRRGGVSGERAAKQKNARAGGREEARDRKRDEKVYAISEAGVGRSCECAGRREEDGRECRPEIRVRSGGSRGGPEACGSRPDRSATTRGSLRAGGGCGKPPLGPKAPKPA